MTTYKVIFEDKSEEIIYANNFAEMAPMAIIFSEKKRSAIKEVWVKCEKVGL